MPNLRDNLCGCPFDHDRLWLIHTAGGAFAMSDYNWEITGADPKLAELDDAIHYGGNAYYVVGTLAERKGWRVEVQTTTETFAAALAHINAEKAS